MKTISGKVVSTKPISLSKAAKVLSTFVASANTGASQAVSTYLRRSSESFSELAQFHKELKASNSGHKREKHRRESINHGNSITLYENPNEDEVGRKVEDSVRKRDKKKEKKMGTEDVERESGGNLGIEVGERKEKKKRKSGEGDDGEVIDSGEQSNSKRKKKKRKMEGDV